MLGVSTHLQSQSSLQPELPTIDVFRDTSGQISLEDILDKAEGVQFEAIKGSFLPLGFDEYYYWLRISLPELKGSLRYVLSLSTTHIEEVYFYYQAPPKAKWEVRKGGYRVNWQEKDYKFHTPIFPIPQEIDPVVYIRFKNKNIGFQISIEEVHSFARNTQLNFYFFGLFCGLMLFVIIYNLYLAFYMKSQNHYIYSLLTFCYLLFAASYEGYLYYMVKDIPWYVHHFTTFGTSFITALCWGLVPVYVTSFYHILKGSIWVTFRNVLIGFWVVQVLSFLYLPLVVMMAKTGALLVLIYTVSLSWKKIKENYPGSRYFLIAYILYFIATCLEVLFLDGKIACILPVQYTTVGTLLEALILSSSLAQKTANEKLRLQIEKDMALNENIRLIKEQKHMLELMVREKTFKIRKKNRTLKGLNRELRKQQNEILEQKEAISKQNELLKEAYDTIDTQNREIQDRNENLEEQVKARTKELLEHNQALQQFAFIAAHNLRAPVSRIKGLGELWLYPDTSPEDEKLYKDYIFRSISELDEVIQDLSHILNIRKNYTQVLTEVSLREEFERVQLNLSDEILRTQALVEAVWEGEITLHTIKPYLYSILYNLITNAIKYRQEDRNPHIIIRAREEEKELCLEVQDNGMGIDLEAYGKKIFQLYQRFHFHVEGKGMGLFLIKTQVNALKGRIEVESTPNEGSTFKIFFPQAMCEAN